MLPSAPIADLAVASHLIGAARFGVTLDVYPRVASVAASLMAIPEVAAHYPHEHKNPNHCAAGPTTWGGGVCESLF
jgi:hypothetical protein